MKMLDIYDNNLYLKNTKKMPVANFMPIENGLKVTRITENAFVSVKITVCCKGDCWN